MYASQRRPNSSRIGFTVVLAGLIVILLFYSTRGLSPFGIGGGAPQSNYEVVQEENGGLDSSSPTKIDSKWFQLPGIRADLSGGRTDHLIMVAGHAVLSGDASKWKDERSWILEPHQKGTQGIFIKTLGHHMRIAMTELKKNFDRSIVMFSGGQTRDFPMSEGSSYYLVSRAEGFFQGTRAEANEVAKRVFAEEFARDSLENVLFSIARFKEITGSYPSYITCVGFEYKRPRFFDHHRKALRFPEERFFYKGFDMPDAAKKEDIELPPNFPVPSDERSIKAAMADPYLCSMNKATRQKRNTGRRVPSYFLSAPEMVPLLHWCGPDLYPSNPALPWLDAKQRSQLGPLKE